MPKQILTILEPNPSRAQPLGERVFEIVYA
jgi:hypothetical protein